MLYCLPLTEICTSTLVTKLPASVSCALWSCSYVTEYQYNNVHSAHIRHKINDKLHPLLEDHYITTVPLQLVTQIHSPILFNPL
jgi:hypothetical protein